MSLVNTKSEKKEPFIVFAGPCVIESEVRTRMLAKQLKEIVGRYDVDFYFKASWDKANRTKAENYRGPGLEKGMEILASIKKDFGVKIITDIHEPWQAGPVAEVADIIQIPAFLCRQTDLLRAAAQTGRMLNVKKAQFMSPEEMLNIVQKLEFYKAKSFFLCERGTSFGYGNLIVDMTGIVQLARLGYPVIFDATHSVQINGGGVNCGNSGRREFVPYLARAAVATGVISGVFMEVHDDPDSALCDGSCMLHLSLVDPLLKQLLKIQKISSANLS